jgi:hypothetical protein
MRERKDPETPEIPDTPETPETAVTERPSKPPKLFRKHGGRRKSQFRKPAKGSRVMGGGFYR